MNDPELFELCKEVYKRTGWETGQPGYYRENEVVGTSSEGSFLKTATNRETLPLYSSDYLLEKLPFPTELGRDSFAWIGKWEQGAGSAPKRQVWERANTPLKALLKLVIALHEAGDVS